MIAELENILFRDSESDQKIKHIMYLSEDLRKDNSKFKLGSDEHLDYISAKTTKLNDLIASLKSLNDHFETVFPNNKEDGEILVKILHLLHSVLSLAIANLNKENKRNSFSTCIFKLKAENEQIIEYIDDINEFIVSDEKLDLFED